MSLRNTLRNPATLFRIGLLALLVSIALMWAGRSANALSADLLDGARGLLIGISIASLIQSMRLQRNRPSSGGPC